MGWTLNSYYAGNRSGLREPVVLHSTTGVLKAMDVLKQSDSPIALVANGFGMLQGLITPITILKAIAGEFPHEGEVNPFAPIEDDCWKAFGTADLRDLEERLGIEASGALGKEHDTLSRLRLIRLDKLPDVGDVLDLNGIRFEVTEVIDRQIASVKVSMPNLDNGERSEPELS
jgi:CBS domain containing-hemolysin-like protein